MALVNFIARSLPAISADWLNEIDRLKVNLLDNATTKNAGRTALELDSQVVANGTDSGAANSAVVTISGMTTYIRAVGSKVVFAAAATNTGPATLDVNGTGPAAILDQLGAACTGGELSRPVMVIWTGAAWQIILGGIPTANRRSAAEIAAGVTPVDYGYAPEPLIDPRRYHAGTIGNAVDDLAAVNTALTVLRQSGGTLLIPSLFNSTMTLPALGLSNNQSGCIIDLRADRANVGNGSFGAVDIYIEGRDNGGNYASEVRALGKHHPAFVANTLSDGTANGYPKANYASSFLHEYGQQGHTQYISDPLFGAYYSWALVYFAGSTGKYGLWMTIDSNAKPRFTLAPANLEAATGNILGASNASPIVITTDGAHGLAGVHQPVTIANVGGNTAANGSWEVAVLTSDTFSLIGSAGNGAYTSGGTYSGQKNHSRGTLNVPSVQGGTIAILTEGQVFSTLVDGNAPLAAQSRTIDANLHARPAVYNISGTQQVGVTPGSGGAKVVIGNIDLVAGSATVNLSGAAGFSTSGSYKVCANDITAANAVKVTRVSGAQFTLTGTGTDSIDFIAVGF